MLVFEQAERGWERQVVVGAFSQRFFLGQVFLSGSLVLWVKLFSLEEHLEVEGSS